MVIQFSPIFNEKLGYVLGVLLGDGCVYGSYGGICLKVKDYDFAEAFTNDLSIMLGKNYSYKIRKTKEGYYRVDAWSKKFAEWYKSLSYDELWGVMAGNIEMARGFLRGVFDAEGSHKRYLIKADNTDVELIILTVDLLDYCFGIEADVHEYLYKVQCSILRIYIPACYHKQFLEEIGFSIKRKQEVK